MPITILAIESSCDDTSAAVCRDGHILSNITNTQQIHEKYGGVVPELASRAHLQKIVPVVEEALNAAGCRLSDADAFAFTSAPGLIGSLLVGAQFAKSMALALDKPLINVHHMQAHVLANLIPQNKPLFPFLCLTVSGGHTQIVLCKSTSDMEVIGHSLDDAAGEAFDKSAKIIGLPYPGGPMIDKLAAGGDPHKFKFPEPKIAGLNFSFSGLKTAFIYFIRDGVKADPAFIDINLNDICASIQARIISILLNKLKLASQQTGIKDVCIAGGVSANRGLRKAFFECGKAQSWNTFIPPFEYCTDNAGMIAITAYYKYLNNEFAEINATVAARSAW